MKKCQNRIIQLASQSIGHHIVDLKSYPFSKNITQQIMYVKVMPLKILIDEPTLNMMDLTPEL